MAITAKDVQELRQKAGVGMMEAKRALEEANGDQELAIKTLREKGLIKAAERSERENTQGAVAVAYAQEGRVGAIVQLKSETDFVAKSPEFRAMVQAMADTVANKGEAAIAEHTEALDTMKLQLKENIDLGTVVRFEAPEGGLVDTYLHIQSERGVNATMVEVVGVARETAHDISLHIAFARPKHLTRNEVPADVVEAEKATLEQLTRNEGKPEAAIAKIVEGRIGGFFRDNCLIEQEWAKDNKVKISDLVGKGTLNRFAQVEIG